MSRPSPLVSIVIATLNRANVLENCLRSVFRQDASLFELIVVDGGSTDGTADIIAEHSSRIAYWHSRKDAGVYHAWNQALDRCSGEWVLFLGSDDELYSEDVISSVAATLEENSDVGLVYFPTIMGRRDSPTARTNFTPPERIPQGLRKGMPFPHPSTFHRLSMLRELGGFDDRFKIAGDYDLVLRAQAYGYAGFDAPIVTVMGTAGLSQHPKHALLKIREIMAARKKNGYAPIVLADVRPFSRDLVLALAWRLGRSRHA